MPRWNNIAGFFNSRFSIQSYGVSAVLNVTFHPKYPKFRRRASRAGLLHSPIVLLPLTPNIPTPSRRASRAGILFPEHDNSFAMWSHANLGNVGSSYFSISVIITSGRRPMHRWNNIGSFFNSGFLNSCKLIILGRAKVEMQTVLERTVYYLGHLCRETVNYSIEAPTPFIFAGAGGESLQVSRWLVPRAMLDRLWG